MFISILVSLWLIFSTHIRKALNVEVDETHSALSFTNQSALSFTKNSISNFMQTD